MFSFYVCVKRTLPVDRRGGIELWEAFNCETDKVDVYREAVQNIKLKYKLVIFLFIKIDKHLEKM